MNFSQLQMLLKLGREFGHEQIRDAGFSDTEHASARSSAFTTKSRRTPLPAR